MIGLVLRKAGSLALLSLLLLWGGIAMAQVSVTSTTGRSTSATYSTIKVAFDSINGGEHTGRIAVSVTASHTLSAPAVLNASGTGSASFQSVTITSTGVAVISGNPGAYRGLIELNGADSVIINGDAPGGTAYDLTLQNTSTATNSAIIKLTSGTTANSGCKDVIIQGVWLQGGKSDITDYIGVFLGSTSSSAFGPGNDHDNVKILRNRFNKMGYAVRCTSSTTNWASNLLIRENNIGNDSAATYIGKMGILLIGCDSATIERNIIRNISGSWGASDVAGISIEGSSKNCIVRQNSIYRIQQTSSSGYGAWGINFNGGGNNAAINNKIWNLYTRNYGTSTQYNAFGIRLAAGTGHKIYHNSVHMYGTLDLGTALPLSAALVVTSTSVTSLDIRNNIFSNKTTSTVTGARFYGIYVVSGYTWTNMTLDNNGYYLATTTSTNNYYTGGITTPTNYATLADWQTATGRDMNSVPDYITLPPFTNDSTLTIPYGTTTALESGGSTAPGVNIDFDDSVRATFSGYVMTPAGTAPDIGADEFIGIVPTSLRMAAIINSMTAFDCSRTTIPVKGKLFLRGKSLVAGDTIYVGYNINNGTRMDLDTIILTAAMNNGDSIVHTFNTPPNITGITSVNMKVFLFNSKDFVRANDTLVSNFSNVPCRTMPYAEDLETNNGFFYSPEGGWVYGTPAKTNLNAAYSGSNAWMTSTISGSYINYAAYYLYSPIFKLQGVCAPMLSFRTNFKTETNYDAMILEGSRDGINWTKLNFNYNNTSTNGPVAPNKFSGNSGGFILAAGSVDAFRTDSLFQFRLYFGSDVSGVDEGFVVDSFNITYFQMPSSISFTASSDITRDSILTDAPNLLTPAFSTANLTLKWYMNDTLRGTGLTFTYSDLLERTSKLTLRAFNCKGDSVSFTKYITSYDPTFPELLVAKYIGTANQFRNCAPATLPVTVQIRNRGIPMNAGDTIVLKGNFRNGAQVETDTIILTAPLLKKDSINHTFRNAFNVNSIKDLDFLFEVKTRLDIVTINDTLRMRTSYQDCKLLPYTETFETDNGGWSSSNWVWGTPAKTNINSAGQGSKSWITASLTAAYANSSTYDLISAPINFSPACKNPSMAWKMRFITENNYDALIVEVSTDSLNWTKVTADYNNTSASGPIAPPKYSGDNGAWMTYNASLKPLANSTIGWVRFRFGSDISNVGDGFAIDSVVITPFPKVNPAPFGILATTDATRDTLYTLQQNSFRLNTNDTNFYVVDWYMDGVFQSSDSHMNYRPTTAGTYTVKAVLRNCDYTNSDSATKIFTVIDPVGLPRPNFIADKYRVQILDNVNFINLSQNGIYKYKWRISPLTQFDPDQGLSVSAYQYTGGTSDSSVSPRVLFSVGGQYEICLIATNYNGSDSVCKSQYITVDQVTNIINAYTYWDKGYVYDSGGKNGAYANNENFVFMIRPCGADTIRFRLNSLATENNADYLRIYDGDTSGTPLWDKAAYPNGLTGTMALGNTYVSTSGVLTIWFRSNGSTTAAGFEGYWESVSSPKMPVAVIDVPDTVGEGMLFEGQALGSQPYAYNYEWDLDGDGFLDFDTREIEYSYSFSGLYRIQLIVSNCYGSDTTYKDVVVVVPGRPVANFTADYTNPGTGDVVTFTDSLGGYADQFQWYITPNTFSYVNGTDSFSRRPQVIFNQPGCYNVKFAAANPIDGDTIEKICYINVHGVCQVSATNVNSDLAITKVSVNGNMMPSSLGTSGYSNYYNILTFTVNRGYSYNFMIERGTTVNPANRNIWIDLNQDGDFSDAGEWIAREPMSNDKVWTFPYRIPAAYATGTYRMRVGIAFENQAADPCGVNAIGEFEDYKLVIGNGVDNILPVIEFPAGTDTLYVPVFGSYTDPGAIATDEPLGDTLTSSIVITGAVDTAVTGTYVINFSVTDAAGNTASRNRVVFVYDSIAPVITLIGMDPDTIELNDSYMDPGVTVTDNYDTGLGYTVTGFIDSSRVGAYVLEYITSDAAGNTNSIRRTVVVRDRTSPQLNIVTGFDVIHINLCEYVVPMEYLIISDNDSSCTPGVIVTRTYDPTVLGPQNMDMMVVDCQGNTSNVVTFTIMVEDHEVPAVKLNGANSITMERWTSYYDAGITATDNSFCAMYGLKVDTLGTYENTLAEGSFWIQYKATDSSGNVSFSEVRWIEVTENTTGIQSLALNGISFDVYPNPSEGRFMVTLSFKDEQAYRLSATNLLGQEVALIGEGQFSSGKVQADLTQLAAGTYFIQLETNGQVFNHKVVITR